MYYYTTLAEPLHINRKYHKKSIGPLIISVNKHCTQHPLYITEYPTSCWKLPNKLNINSSTLLKIIQQLYKFNINSQHLFPTTFTKKHVQRIQSSTTIQQLPAQQLEFGPERQCPRSTIPYKSMVVFSNSLGRLFLLFK